MKKITHRSIIDHSHIVLIIGDLNGLGHLSEFADQISGQSFNTMIKDMFNLIG